MAKVVKKAIEFEAELYVDGKPKNKVGKFRNGKSIDNDAVLHFYNVSKLEKFIPEAGDDRTDFLIATFLKRSNNDVSIMFKNDLDNVLFFWEAIVIGGRKTYNLYFFDKAPIIGSTKVEQKGEKITINDVSDNNGNLKIITYTEQHRKSPV